MEKTTCFAPADWALTLSAIALTIVAAWMAIKGAHLYIKSATGRSKSDFFDASIYTATAGIIAYWTQMPIKQAFVQCI